MIGLFGGFFGGLLGIGGSFLVIPFLKGVIKISPHKAHATALPVAFASGISALGFYFTSGQVDIGLSVYVMIGCLTGVMFGSKLMNYVKGNLLSLMFGFFLLALAVVFALPISPISPMDSHTDLYTITISVILGLFAGLSSGLFGAGGGTILVPGIVLLLGVGEHMAQGISLLVIIPTTLLGTWMHYKQKKLSLTVAPWLTISSFAGGLLGGFFAILTHVTILKSLIVIALLYIGFDNIRKNLRTKKISSVNQTM